MSARLIDGYVSADGHVVEPADLWTTRMDRRFRDRAPHIETRKSVDFYVIDGLDPVAVGVAGSPSRGYPSGSLGPAGAAQRPGAR